MKYTYAGATLFSILTMVIPLGAHAAERTSAVWFAHPILLCKGQDMETYNDDGTSFNKQSSTAVWKIQFASNSVTYLNMDITESILHKQTPRTLSNNSVILLNSGRLMVFFPMTKTSLGQPFYPAKLVGVGSWSQTERTNFKCYPGG